MSLLSNKGYDDKGNEKNGISYGFSFSTHPYPSLEGIIFQCELVSEWIQVLHFVQDDKTEGIGQQDGKGRMTFVMIGTS